MGDEGRAWWAVEIRCGESVGYVSAFGSPGIRKLSHADAATVAAEVGGRVIRHPEHPEPKDEKRVWAVRCGPGSLTWLGLIGGACVAEADNAKELTFAEAQAEAKKATTNTPRQVLRHPRHPEPTFGAVMIDLGPQVASSNAEPSEVAITTIQPKRGADSRQYIKTLAHGWRLDAKRDARDWRHRAQFATEDKKLVTLMQKAATTLDELKDYIDSRVEKRDR